MAVAAVVFHLRPVMMVAAEVVFQDLHRVVVAVRDDLQVVISAVAPDEADKTTQ